MSADSPIEWTDHTFNPWWGCTKISPGCDHCYAERIAQRFGTGWGDDAERRTFWEEHWLEPVRWNARALRQGGRFRVFCASMADVFDNHEGLDDIRAMLWQLIADTPQLDWQLLTKRVGNVRRMVPPAWLEGAWPANAWIGASVVNQAEADRDVPKLLGLPAWIRFLSCEPLLGPINLREIRNSQLPLQPGEIVPIDPWLEHDALTGVGISSIGFERSGGPTIQWVIAGGESGPHARPAHPDWFRSLRDQCVAASVPFLLKQHGEWIECETEVSTDRPGTAVFVDDGYGVELVDGRRYPTMADHGADFVRVGKRLAGRQLDGAEHSEFPPISLCGNPAARSLKVKP